jgi:hypothetical protein
MVNRRPLNFYPKGENDEKDPRSRNLEIDRKIERQSFTRLLPNIRISPVITAKNRT